MADVLIKACAFILMILLGFILKKRHVFGPEAFGVVSKIVLNITLPCAVVTNFNGFFMEYTMLGIVVIGAVLNLLMMGLGFLAAPKKNREERAFNMLKIGRAHV